MVSKGIGTCKWFREKHLDGEGCSQDGAYGKYETIFPFSESKGLSVEYGAGAKSEDPAVGRSGRGRCFMIAELFDLVFGCHHSRYSFPVTIRGSARRPQAGALTGTYVACLDCGKEFPYDWQEMRVITSRTERQEYGAALATKHAG